MHIVARNDAVAQKEVGDLPPGLVPRRKLIRASSQLALSARDKFSEILSRLDCSGVQQLHVEAFGGADAEHHFGDHATRRAAGALIVDIGLDDAPFPADQPALELTQSLAQALAAEVIPLAA